MTHFKINSRGFLGLTWQEAGTGGNMVLSLCHQVWNDLTQRLFLSLFCTLQILGGFEEFHLKILIPLREASSSLKENRAGKCEALSWGAASASQLHLSTLHLQGKDSGSMPPFPLMLWELLQVLSQATSVRGRASRNNSQCTRVWDARQTKSSGERTEEQLLLPSINRNFKEVDIKAKGLDRPHLFFHSISDCRGEENAAYWNEHRIRWYFSDRWYWVIFWVLWLWWVMLLSVGEMTWRRAWSVYLEQGCPGEI